MKKFLAVIGIILPFIFGLLWLVSFVFLAEITGEPTSTIIFASYAKLVGMMGTLVWLITLVIGLVYLWKQKWLEHKAIMKQSRILTRKNIRKFALGIVFLFILQMLQNGLSQPDQPVTFVVVILMILIWVAYLWIDLWLKSMSLSLTDDKKIKVSDIFVDGKKLLYYLGAYVIIWIFAVVGIVLFIIPGIYVTLRLNMVPYLILEKNIGPWKAIKESRTMTKSVASNIFALNVLLGMINILWIIALFVWLFWTLPLFYIANAVFYKKLLLLKK